MFRTKLSRVQKPISLLVLNEELRIVENTKFLGLHIDEFLDWSEHINILSKKLNSICYGIRIVGRYMSEKMQKVVYFANFESILKYGIVFWGSSSQLKKIFTVQKRVIRCYKKMQYRESCRGVFKREGILTAYGIYIMEALIFFFNHREEFDLQTFHSYNTRTINVNYPIHRLTLTEKSPYYMCLRLYNHLPDRIRSISSKKIFKIKIKQFLVELEPYCMNDYFVI